MTQPESNATHSQEMQRVLHDLSNTLTGLLMNAGLLSLALRSNERLRRYADDINESATHGAELLRKARLMIDGAENGSTLEEAVTDECDAEHTRVQGGLRLKRNNLSTRTH